MKLNAHDHRPKEESAAFYRLMLVLGSVVYPLWQPLQHYVEPQAIDPLSARLYISALGVLAWATSRSRRVSAAAFERLFLLCCAVLTAHAFYLVKVNGLNGHYVAGSLVVVTTVATCIQRLFALVGYLAYVVVLGLSACQFDLLTHESIHFISLVATAVAVLYPTLALRLKLTRSLASTASALDRMVGNAATGIAHIDMQGRFTQVNQRAAETFGLPSERMIGKALTDLTISEDRSDTARSLRQLLTGDVESLCLDQRVGIGSDNGEVKWVRLYATPLRSAKGKIEGLVAVVIDVTKEKLLEFVLTGKQQLLEMVASGSSEDEVLRAVCEFIYIHLDSQACVILALDAANQRVSSKAALGVPLPLLKKLDQARTDGLGAVAAAATAARQLTTALANDGEPRWARFFDVAAPFGIKAVFAAPIISRSGSVFGTVELYAATPRQASSYELKTLAAFGEIIGLTMEKHRNDRLIEAQKMKVTASAKMASLGEMAAGIGHEINNPMTIILGRSYLIRQLLASDGANKTQDIMAACTSIEATVKRVTKIIHGLKSFARSDEGDAKTNVSVASIINETLAFCGERFRNHGVDLEVASVDASLQVIGRPTQVSQVLLNLLNNAFDAVSEQKLRRVQVEVFDRGAMVDLAVTDSGSGIPPAAREKMFQPFFSTKEVGKGTGLGLSISLSIAKEHGGNLYVDDSAATTRFVFTLPRAVDSASKVA